MNVNLSKVFYFFLNFNREVTLEVSVKLKMK